ncbi:MAG: sulfatase-like hydrolase/transferase [Anaerolineae bacterium]|nr:sulfatase-like hydrolase/transferase [Anaerolineae bacterium]
MPNPNVVIFHTSHQRYDSLGCTGNSFVRTPHIDRLAAQGTLFARHIAASTSGMSSRASLFTGLYPPGHNVWTNGVPLNRSAYTVTNPHGTPEPICPEPATLADMFAGAGYDTVAFGKLHLTPNLAPVSYGYPETWSRWEDGSLDDWHGPYYGFRHVEMTLGHGEQIYNLGHYAAWLRSEHPEFARKFARKFAREFAPVHEPLPPIPVLGNLHAFPLPAALHNTAWLADRFCDYLRTRPTENASPFFAFVGFPALHDPCMPSLDVLRDFEEIAVKEPVDPDGAAIQDTPLASTGIDVSGLTPEERRIVLRYTYATLYQIDAAIGQMVEALKQARLWENTIVIFTGDHGDFLCDHGRLYAGYAPDDVLLHVPFILRVPASVLAGGRLPLRVETPMSNSDVLPTLAALAGVTPPVWLQGTNMVDVVREKRSHVALAFCANGQPEMTNYTVYDPTYRFTLYPRTGYVELYDHQEDPGECHNLASHTDFQMHIAAMISAVQARLMQYHHPILARVSAW